MKRGPKPVPEKEHIVELLRRGLFATVTEASQTAGVSRQRVLQWAVAAGIDWRLCRRRHVEAIWAKELRRQRLISKGKTPRKVTKDAMRRVTDKAIVDFRKPDDR